MTLDFEFQFLTYGIMNWIAFILLVSSFVFLVLGSFKQKKDLKELAKLLVIIAIILLVWGIVSLFIPVVTSESPTTSETTRGFLYELILIILIPNLLQLILGIVFILFGLKNIDPSGSIISLAGFFYFIAMFESLFIGIISTYSGWYDPEFLVSLQNIIEIIEWIEYVSYIIAAILIIIYCAKLKSTYLLIYGLITLALGIFNLLSFLEII
ncbi:MAG: hypothetical protein ACFFB0_20960 [Promethearchaeota archaeon]